MELNRLAHGLRNGIGPRTVILGRHGRTVHNRDGRIMGRSDSPLTPEGLTVPLTLANLLAQEGVGRIFCSSLGRARTTAEVYGSKIWLAVTGTDAMAELSCGEWEGKTRLETIGERGFLRSTWNDRPPRGESYLDAETRVGAFVDELLRLPETETVLVVGHASVNRVFLKLWLGIPEEVAIRVDFPHETLHFLRARSEVVRVDATGARHTGLLFYL
ncbi:MAG: histidine phosphatase family protein [Thermodesulfobacteriota bacterium]